jgi:hypothetical protein
VLKRPSRPCVGSWQQRERGNKETGIKECGKSFC